MLLLFFKTSRSRLSLPLAMLGFGLAILPMTSECREANGQTQEEEANYEAAAPVLKLYRQLSASSFLERESAFRKLVELGPSVAPTAIRILLSKEADLEGRYQAMRLLREWMKREPYDNEFPVSDLVRAVDLSKHARFERELALLRSESWEKLSPRQALGELEKSGVHVVDESPRRMYFTFGSDVQVDPLVLRSAVRTNVPVGVHFQNGYRTEYLTSLVDAKLESVEFFGDYTLKNADFVAITRHSELKTVDVRHVNVTSVDEIDWSMLPWLETFGVSASMTDEDLKSLIGLPELKNLYFGSTTRLTGRCLESVAQMQGLRALDIQHFNPAAVELKPLADLNQLSTLYGPANLNLQQAEVIGSFDELAVLTLSKPDASPEMMRCFANLTKLSFLALYNCKLTPETTEAIADIPSLRRLHLNNGDVPIEAMHQLKNLCPDLVIIGPDGNQF